MTTTMTLEEQVAFLTEERTRQDQSVDFLHEALAELELALEDAGWVRLGLSSAYEFSRAGLDQVVRLSRLMFLKNPLIRRAVNVKTFYVWGQGFEIAARDPLVNDALTPFIEDAGNAQAVFAQGAAMMREQDLETDGNVFFALFPNRVTGHVKVRTVPFEEITEIFSNPDDRNEPWFYRRQWSQETISPSGTRTSESRDEWYPDWRYRPTVGTGSGVSWRTSPREAQQVRPLTVDGRPVNWQTPIYHVKVGNTSQMRFGVPEVYPALDWAKAHTKFLEDGATVMRSLARFTWELAAPKKTRSDAAAALQTTLGTNTGTSPETNPPPLAGSLAGLPEGVSLTPINKNGANVGLDDGKHFRLQVAAAVGLPDTFISGDVDTGNHATAATMDRPTELMMLARQELWRDVILDLCGFAIEWAIRGTKGLLAGSVLRDANGNDVVTITGVDDDAIDVNFPPILEHDVAKTITALVAIGNLGGKPWAGVLDRKAWLTEVCSALNLENAEEVIDASLTAWEEADAAKADQAAQISGRTVGTPADDGGTDSSSTPPTPQSADSAMTADANVT